MPKEFSNDISRSSNLLGGNNVPIEQKPFLKAETLDFSIKHNIENPITK